MATRREIRQNIGNYVYKGRRLMELAATATAAASGTVTLPNTGAYPAVPAYFDMYGLSVVGGTGADDERAVTNFVASTGVVTFVTAATYSTDSIIELWQRNLNATRVNGYIHQAIDNLREEALQEWSSTALTIGADRTLYQIPSGPKFLHTVEIYDRTPATGWATSNITTYRALNDASARTQLSQGFKVTGDTLVRGVCLYLRFQGTLFATARTLTANIETNSSGVPSTTEVGGATATRTTDVLGSEGKLIFFDFGRPVLLTDGTQYHITLDSSGTVDATNYVQWGEDDATGTLYPDGAAARATDEGTTWVAIANSDFIFHVVPWSDNWDPLYDSEWDVESETSNNYLRVDPARIFGLPVTGWGSPPVLTEGQPIRILGYQRAARPTSDTAEIDIPRAYIESYALAGVLTSLGDPALMPTIAYLQGVAQRELQQHPIRTNLRAGARRVITGGA